jgi:hypothetical protein
LGYIRSDDDGRRGHLPFDTGLKLRGASPALRMSTKNSAESGASESTDKSEPGEFNSPSFNESDPFEVVLEPEDNPTCLSSLRKWVVVAVISGGAGCVTCDSSMVCPFGLPLQLIDVDHSNGESGSIY